MAKNSTIEWTDHTFNPWWGCVKVSPACKHCYAHTWSNRFGLQLWGGNADRRFFSDSHWREPLRWNAEAARDGMRRRVFCASMADIFEVRSDLNQWRERLWKIIESTPALDWLLLTKRPEQVGRKVPWGDSWPKNVWLGTTVENQKYAERRIPILLKYPATVRFVSCEPLLGPLNLSRWLTTPKRKRGIDWVIAGGESGPHARPMDPNWARGLRDQCAGSAASFHFKQWGQWSADGKHQKGAKVLQLSSGFAMAKVGKHLAGRILDGRTWNELPKPESGTL